MSETEALQRVMLQLPQTLEQRSFDTLARIEVLLQDILVALTPPPTTEATQVKPKFAQTQKPKYKNG